MTALDFNSLETNTEVAWPKRGRKRTPIPEALANALHQSFTHGSTASMVLLPTKVETFKNLLAKAGKELNYRIEHNVVDDPEHPGYKIYYFRTRAHRKSETANA